MKFLDYEGLKTFYRCLETVLDGIKKRIEVLESGKCSIVKLSKAEYDGLRENGKIEDATLYLVVNETEVSEIYLGPLPYRPPKYMVLDEGELDKDATS